MTRDEAKRVQRWLYSIKAKEHAIENIKSSIERMETRLQSMPTLTQQITPTPGRSGEQDSQPEKWILFLEQYQSRIEVYNSRLDDYRNDIDLFNRSLAELAHDEKWGSMAARILHSKYYRMIYPDEKIYSELFCGKTTFYKLHNHGIRFMFSVIPSLW